MTKGWIPPPTARWDPPFRVPSASLDRGFGRHRRENRRVGDMEACAAQHVVARRRTRGQLEPAGFDTSEFAIEALVSPVLSPAPSPLADGAHEAAQPSRSTV
ncbi:hypothetical protein [Microbacterium sp. LWH3-1.2]|uniref:hypothetical protein n=1 Tax=Microbacterium sp. LWH3-1.2 TaxID=3135256 RepID=UPI0034346ACB